MRRIVSLLLVGGCAARPAHPIPIAIVVDGDRAAIGALPKTVDALELHEVALPAAPPADDHQASLIVSRARAAYVKGDLEGCRTELRAVAIDALLAAGDRATAARAIAFDAACAWAATTKTEALADARRFAELGLDLPESAVAPDVEAILGDAIAASGKDTRHTLTIAGEVGARVTVDGRPAGCALPCSVDIGPGDHVLAVDADGFSPTVQHVSDVDHVTIAQQPAPAALAAQQWRARIGRGQPAADATGAALIARFAGDARVAFVHGDASLSGALVVDGKLVASKQAKRGEASDLVRELAYDGGVLHRPAVWQRPWFWIAVSGAALVVAGTIVALTYSPPPDTHLGF